MPVSPNFLAWVALALWPVVALVYLGSARARANLAAATAWMMLLPTMFLPAALDLKIAPGLPDFDKHRLAFLSLAAGLLAFHRRRLGPRPEGIWWVRGLFLVLGVCLFQTVANNTVPLRYGTLKLAGLTSHDAYSSFVALLLDRFVPFWVGMRVFRTEDDLRALFRVLTTCGLIYLPLAVVEVRLSPVLHNWVYGYTQHFFLQMVRSSGYRPLLFMAHGLSVALFAALAFIASLGLWRVRDPARPRPWIRVGGLLLLLALCKSMGSILYSVFGLVMLPLLRRRAGKWILVAVAAVVVSFPMTRFTGAFPVERVVELASRVSLERAGSLAFRLENEDLLLRRAMQRPFFGWGGWGRNRVYDEQGYDQAVTDGQWIIVLGAYGAVGLAGLLLMTIVPLFRFIRHQRRMPPEARVLAGQLAIIVTACTVDLLPNAWGDALPFAYAGALFTLSGTLRRRRARPGALARLPAIATPEPDGAVVETSGRPAVPRP